MNIQEINRLSIEERISIIGEIWKTIDKGKIQVTDAQKIEVRERIERYKKDETKFFTWDEIRAELRKAK